jgi:hypothetical protein
VRLGSVRSGNERTKCIENFLADINEHALRVYASSLRSNQPCEISGEYSVGTCYAVRKIRFEDGLEWIARFRMPPYDGEAENKELVRSEMESELDTMMFIR